MEKENADLMNWLIKNEPDQYYNFKELMFDGVKYLCCLSKFMFTTGIIIGLDYHGFLFRYCFESKKEAEMIFNDLTEVPKDVISFKGNWTKCKGSYNGKIYDDINPNKLKEHIN